MTTADNLACYFFLGRGEISKKLSSKNWKDTTVGLPEHWCDTLCSNINILLNSSLPMFLFWGDDFTCFYNDAFIKNTGSKKVNHDNIGLDGKDFWGNEWIEMEEFLFKVLLGKPTSKSENLVFANLASCSIIYNENAKKEGVLIICNNMVKNTSYDEKENNEIFTKTILQSSPDCIKVIDKSGTIVYMNDRGVCVLDGANKNDFITKSWISFWKVEYHSLVGNAIIKGLGGEIASFQAPAVTLKGITKWFDVLVSPINNDNDEVQDLLVSSRDITKQKEAVLELEESERQLRFALDGGDLGYFDAYPQTGYLNWSKRTKSFFGLLDNDEVNVELFKSLVHPEDFERANNTLLTVFAEKKEFYVHEYRTNTENFKWLKVQGKVTYDENGLPYRATGIIQDITENKTASLLLEESENRFRMLADQSPTWIWITDKEVNVLYANNTLLQFLGFKSFTEFTGQVWEQITFPDDIEVVYNKYEEGTKTLKSFSFECRVKNVNNNLYEWIFLTVAPRFVDEIFVGFIGSAFNIHQKKEQEFALQQSLFKQDQTLAQLNSLLKNAPVGFAFFDKDYRYVQINECLAEINGVSMQDHIGKTVTDVLADTGKSVVQILDKIIETKEPIFNLEVKGQTPKEPGIDRYWITGFYPILNSRQNDVDFIGAVVIEITDRKKIEESIKESENRFKSLAETIPQLVWETDAKGNQIYASSKWNDFIDKTLTPEESWKAIVHPSDYENINSVWSHCLKTGDKYVTEVRLKNKAGKYIWHTVAGDPVFDKNHNIIKWIGAFTDINTEKEFAESLKKQVDERTVELEKTKDILEVKNDELQKMNKELESFAYISSHDLQEPLRKIQIFSAQIMDKEFECLSDDGKNKFKRIENAAKRMKILIEDLLAYSRTSIAERIFEITDLDIIINLVKEDLKEEILNKNASIITLSTHKLSIIPFQFRQLVYNLISNALKFTIENKTPQIIINSKIVDGSSLQKEFHSKNITYCHISLSDNGIGFDQKYSHKIFDVFQRLHSRVEFAGTGIGLAIVKKIVDNHNGFISAEAKLGNGATFNIYLPYLKL